MRPIAVWLLGLTLMVPAPAADAQQLSRTEGMRPAYGGVIQIGLDDRSQTLYVLDNQFIESPGTPTWRLLTFDERAGKRTRALPWTIRGVNWISVEPASGLLYLSDDAESRILVYDPDHGAMVRTIKTPNYPGPVSFGARQAYVPLFNSVGIIDKQTGALSEIPAGMLVATVPVVEDPSGKVAYAIGGANCLLVIDPATRKVRTTIGLASPKYGDVGRGPCAMELDDRRSLLYILFPWPRHEVLVLDTHRLEGPHRSFPVHEQAYALALDAARKRLYTANVVEMSADADVAADSVSVLDASTGTTLSTIITPAMFGIPGIWVNRSNGHIYVGLQAGGVAVYDPGKAGRKPAGRGGSVSPGTWGSHGSTASTRLRAACRDPGPGNAMLPWSVSSMSAEGERVAEPRTPMAIGSR